MRNEEDPVKTLWPCTVVTTPLPQECIDIKQLPPPLLLLPSSHPSILRCTSPLPIPGQLSMQAFCATDWPFMLLTTQL